MFDFVALMTALVLFALIGTGIVLLLTAAVIAVSDRLRTRLHKKYGDRPPALAWGEAIEFEEWPKWNK